MSNRYNKVLYVGITSYLIKRVWEHKNKVVDGFTKRYNLYKLVYYEIYDDIETAINREKQIKSWPRKKKIVLINAFNPSWDDLYEKLSK
ncbi:MAG: GIY-YIG nuclease superfamily protein [Candidatus Atribacteria bacterium ADurb.Bin276]|uniref:GIY-YIG nuclease superfamily protein n=1 Tax=Candidatus Atribacter allofermentans TaxID=1852833 RepID=A0A1V5SHU1_9BACT|nr:MAG: GIY-YIG nuclease superfamily protein [Candidatus Atribacteria bacterium ADurb.Bin276]